MPKKVRELKALLSKAGFRWRPGKGSHTIWEHPLADKSVTLSGNDNRDARHYQEHQVEQQLAVVRKAPTVTNHYSMLIRWSDVDEVFIVTLPEFDFAKTHGDTYQAAATQGCELIESFIMWYRQDGKSLPEPRVFVHPGEEDVEAFFVAQEEAVG